MTTDLIRYDLLVQDALKGVVRKVLSDAARDGLPGDHHFYVSFQTGFPGVRLSSRMREKYPDTMTIVLQHQFWDLAITEHAFEVGLSFGGVPERLLVPFDALTGFFDPSVQFGLKFEIREAPEGAAGPTAVPGPAPVGEPARPLLRGAGSEPAETEPRRSPTPRIAPKANGEETERPQATPQAADGGADEAPPKGRKRAPAADGAETPADPRETGDAAEGQGDQGDQGDQGAQVVSLDAFRKKT
ncbi:ClpXP protease specificity-enhancing factor SspB [Salinarimonas sp.]|uniref:SspB family protein n=1 Tax=Salinarimonas sp. TaxID=2766526 RepID=UPI0032D8B4D8